MLGDLLNMPLVAAGAVILAPLVFRPRRENGRELVAVLSVAAGFALGHAGLVGAPRWGPWEHQPFWLALVAAPLTLPAILWKPACVWTRLGCAGLLGVSIGLLVVLPAREIEWGASASGWALSVGVSLLAAAVTGSTATLCRRDPGTSMSVVLALMLAGVAVLCLSSGYAAFAVLALVLAVTIVPLSAHRLVRRLRGDDVATGLGQGVGLVVTALFAALLFGGYLHTLADERLAAPWFALVGLSPLAAWLAELPAFASRPRLRWAVRVAAVGLPVLAALVHGLTTVDGDAAGDAGSEWGEWGD